MTTATDRLVITEPGVYDIPDVVYHADPIPGGSLSSSGARRLIPPSTPARFKWEQDHPVYKNVYDQGHAAHKLVLGAGAEFVVIDADDYRTKAAREERDAARAEGLTPLLAAEHAVAQGMARALVQHPIASRLLAPGTGRPEQSLFWQDDLTGVWRRARLDWLPNPIPGRRMIVTDYKTTKAADDESLRKDIANYGYHQQCAWYKDAVVALGLDAEPAMVFVFQEREPPYLVAVKELDHDSERIGRARNDEALGLYAQCVRDNHWPGYAEDVQSIRLPGWYLNRYEELL